MEIIVGHEENPDYILLGDLDPNKHIVVAVIDNVPTVLVQTNHGEKPANYSFMILGVPDDPTPVGWTCSVGNGWDYSTIPEDDEEPFNFKEMVRYTIQEKANTKVAAFGKKQWKRALYFLINNVK